MNVVEIFVEEERLDMYENTDIKFTMQANDIAEVSKRQASYTSMFNVPKTDHNVRLLGGLGIASNTSRISYKKPACKVKLEGFDLIQKGWVHIRETTDEYKIFINSGIIDFFKAIENKTFKDIDIKEADHEKNLMTVMDSFFGSTPYRYLIADYNGKTNYIQKETNNIFAPEGSVIINIDYLVPSIRVKYLWDKVHEKFGFNYIGEIFKSDRFLDWWMTYPKAAAIDDGNFEKIVEVEGDAILDFINKDRYVVIGVRDFTRNYFEVKDPGEYRFRLKGKVDMPKYVDRLEAPVTVYASFNSEGIEFSERTNIQKVGTINSTEPFELKKVNRSLTAGEKVSFFVYYPIGQHSGEKPSLRFNIVVEKLKKGAGSLSEQISDLRITDFVKEVINHFGLTMLSDEYSNDIRYLTLSDRFKGEVVDWSEKYIERTSETYVYQSYAQKNVFLISTMTRKALTKMVMLISTITLLMLQNGF